MELVHLEEGATAKVRSAVVTLWEGCGLTRPWNPPERDLAQAIAGPTSTVVVALEDERMVGSVLAGYDGHRGWLYYLAVDPTRRGAGLARTLVTTAETWLARAGARKVQLMVREGNPAASLYPHLGYERQDTAVYGRWLEG
ncbi:GNAT family acetyltransferase [Litorihabitans aurantiacus]|uniref:GNAT family acetyltransferase n=1 Tax=Litorihabitans aurantiacus TaxID=1930061 RepID=A0AA38CTY7_9MICO|nr:GNAT family acetyltransferase [Litorihabitans aurantiacus]GMA32232.1 GNAT family acetyltransferase [Litorihabitans aurantiacus]